MGDSDEEDAARRALAMIQREALEQDMHTDPLEDANMQFTRDVVQGRAVAVQRIAQDVETVHTIFQDLQEIVQDGVEHLDDIEAHLTRVRENAIDAHSKLQSAASYQQKNRNQMCCMMFCLALAAVLFVLFLTVMLQGR